MADSRRCNHELCIEDGRRCAAIRFPQGRCDRRAMRFPPHTYPLGFCAEHAGSTS